MPVSVAYKSGVILCALIPGFNIIIIFFTTSGLLSFKVTNFLTVGNSRLLETVIFIFQSFNVDIPT